MATSSQSTSPRRPRRGAAVHAEQQFVEARADEGDDDFAFSETDDTDTTSSDSDASDGSEKDCRKDRRKGKCKMKKATAKKRKHDEPVIAEPFDGEEDEAAPALRTGPGAQRRPPRACLRGGVNDPNPEEIVEAAECLRPLPTDYEWVHAPSIDMPTHPFRPSSANSRSTTPDYTDRSLTSIFLEMAKGSLERILTSTNKHGEAKMPGLWKPMTMDGLVHFIALIFHFDDQQRGTLRSYWSEKDPDSFATESGISQRKFMLWYSTVRLYVPEEHTAEEKARNKTWKVDRYLANLQQVFQRMRHPTSSRLSLDEEMTTLKVWAVCLNHLSLC